MNVISLAARNLIRNARRSLATLLAIAIGAISILLFGGYKANIDHTLQTAYVRTGGHLQIQHQDFFLFGSGNPTLYAIDDYEKLVELIKSDPQLSSMVQVVTPTLQFGGVAGNYAAGVSRTVIGDGSVAADQSLMRKWNEYHLSLAAAPMRLEGASANSAVIGVGVARVLQLCEALQISDCPKPEREIRANQGDMPSDLAQISQLESIGQAKLAGGAAEKQAQPSIDLLVSNSRGTPNVAALKVIAAESMGFKEMDEVYMSLQLAQAQRLVYGSGRAKATSIVIQLKMTSTLAAAKTRLGELLVAQGGKQRLIVRDFMELNPFYVQSIQLFGTIFGFMFILIGGIVMFTVSNTMNTAVTERVVEIGTLRAIGLRQAGIRAMFVTEGVLLGCVGAVGGGAVALVSSVLINMSGLMWQPPGSAKPVPLTLQVWGEVQMILVTVAVLIAVTVFSAWWPAFRAAKLNVVDALRHT